ncbi:MAG: DegV family protein [Clostridia bacterium]|nr:DegV family protein [Clostridia bacterium]
MITLFTDTDTDITPEQAKKYGYKLISMPYCANGKTVFPYEDFETFNAYDFYQMLRQGTLPTTSAISSEKYTEIFEPEFAAGNDIFYVHFSRSMTATFDAMDTAVSALKEKYPDRKFYEVDTKGITIISLNIVLEIGDLFLAGKTPEEVLKWAETEVDRFAVYFFADDLKFFARSGRVSGIAGTMGSILGIRPIIFMDENGKMVSVGKETGRSNAVKRLISYVEELGDDLYNHRVIVGHADSPRIAGQIADILREKYGEKLNVLLADVNPTAGSHCGPDTVGVCFHAIHR